MVTTGGRLLFGLATLATVATLAYAIDTGELYGIIVWATFAAVLAFLGGILVAVHDADVRIPVADGDVAAVPIATVPPVSPSLWPLAGGISVATLALGLVTDSRFFLLGIVLALATMFEWIVQAWSDRASADPSYNAGVRGGTLHPIEFPVLGAAAVGVVILGFSRVMLALPQTAALVVFVGIAATILLVAALVASRPRFSIGMVAALLALGGIGIITGGIIGAATGQRELEAHGAEGEAANPDEAVREVADKSSVLAEITIAGDEITISTDGGRTLDELRVPKALTANLLFVNGANDPRRLVVDAGEVATGEVREDGSEVTEPLEFSTGFTQAGKVNFLTFNIPNPGEYELRVEGEEGADAVVARIVVS